MSQKKYRFYYRQEVSVDVYIDSSTDPEVDYDSALAKADKKVIQLHGNADWELMDSECESTKEDK